MYTKEQIANNVQLDIEWIDFLIDCLDMPLEIQKFGEWSEKYAPTVWGLKRLFGPIAKEELSHPVAVYPPASDDNSHKEQCRQSAPY